MFTKDTVVAAIRLAESSEVQREVRTFATTTPALLDLSAWLDEHACTHVAMEATGIYWRPVWQVLDADSRTLILANAATSRTCRPQDRRRRRGLALRPARPRPDPRQLRAEAQTQAMRDLLRTRKQLVREQASHVQRIQKTLEEANLKLASVLTDIMGQSAALSSTRWSRASAIRRAAGAGQPAGEGGARGDPGRAHGPDRGSPPFPARRASTPVAWAGYARRRATSGRSSSVCEAGVVPRSDLRRGSFDTKGDLPHAQDRHGLRRSRARSRPQGCACHTSKALIRQIERLGFACEIKPVEPVSI